jgi:hypothetical protein
MKDYKLIRRSDGPGHRRPLSFTDFQAYSIGCGGVVCAT